MTSSSIVSVIEVGTKRTVVLAGRAREGGGPPEVIGYGEASTTGMRKGRVVTPEYVRTAVSTALAAAVDSARTDLRDLTLVCSCGDVAAEEVRGEARADDPDAVSEADASAALAALERAAASTAPEGREPFGSLFLYYSLDDDPAELHDPAGMPGSIVRAAGLVPHAPERHVQPILDAIYAADCEVNYRVFSGLAAARAALSRQQRQDGALCIDVGGGTTSWCAYRGLRPVALGALPVGGDHVTNDLLSAFKPGSVAAAERFKREAGQAMLRGIAADERVPLHPDLGDPNRTVSRRAAAQVVNARMSELFRLVRDDLRRHDALRHLGAGVVLCGGGALLGGAAALASEIFHAPCSLASFSTGCREIDADPVRNATIWGGLVQAVRKDEAEREAAARAGGFWKRGLDRIFGKEDR